MAPNEVDSEYLSGDSLSHLNNKEKILYQDSWPDLIDFLRNSGKDPKRNIGYAESNIRPTARRIHQVHKYADTIELRPSQADKFVDALNKDQFRTKQGEPYSEGSKRKFTEALQAYFTYRGIEWEPEINFKNGDGTLSSDPFILEEREQLFEAALNYRSPPNYKNVSPIERDRWNAHLAQILGKPKNEVGPEDWEQLRRSWKTACLISITLDCGWRAGMFSRLTTQMVHPDAGEIIIPPETALKNDERWTCELSDRSVRILKKWLEQRNNKTKYDNSDLLFLNRKSNPHHSGTLNDLLENLISVSDIDPSGRKLTWHSIRHSTGMYVYNKEKDIELVAEVLRHTSLESASKYAHPTPETKQDVIESIQGGGI